MWQLTGHLDFVFNTYASPRYQLQHSCPDSTTGTFAMTKHVGRELVVVRQRLCCHDQVLMSSPQAQSSSNMMTDSSHNLLLPQDVWPDAA